MKIALTGSSSTGKTTIAKLLMTDPSFVNLVGDFVTTDARSLLQSLGHTSMDKMSQDESRIFQERYLVQKSENELNRPRLLVDRSYVDVAAYWLVRDGNDLPLDVQQQFEARCRALACQYDLHIYFPAGMIPFASDGYRSDVNAFHGRIANTIKELLVKWGLKHISVESANLQSRLQQILSETLKPTNPWSLDRK